MYHNTYLLSVVKCVGEPGYLHLGNALFPRGIALMHQYNPRPIKTVLCLDAKSFLKELSYLVLSFTLLKFKSVIFTLFSVW